MVQRISPSEYFNRTQTPQAAAENAKSSLYQQPQYTYETGS